MPSAESLESVVGKKLKGEIFCPDFSTDCEGSYDFESKITTIDTDSHSAEMQVAAKAQVQSELQKILDGFVSEYQSL